MGVYISLLGKVQHGLLALYRTVFPEQDCYKRLQPDPKKMTSMASLVCLTCSLLVFSPFKERRRLPPPGSALPTPPFCSLVLPCPAISTHPQVASPREAFHLHPHRRWLCLPRLRPGAPPSLWSFSRPLSKVMFIGWQFAFNTDPRFSPPHSPVRRFGV